MKTFDLTQNTVRELNQALHDQSGECMEREFDVFSPHGQHNIPTIIIPHTSANKGPDEGPNQ